MKNKHFEGNLEVNDENIKLNFNGLANFSSKEYTFDFKAVVDYCDLNTITLLIKIKKGPKPLSILWYLHTLQFVIAQLIHWQRGYLSHARVNCSLSHGACYIN